MVTVTDHSQIAGFILPPLQFFKSPAAAAMRSERLRAIVERVDSGGHRDAGTWDFVRDQRHAELDVEPEW